MKEHFSIRRLFISQVVHRLCAAVIIISFLIFAAASSPTLAVVDSVQEDKGRTLDQCAAGLYRFLASPRSDFYGFMEDIRDYFRDFLLWPSHQADVLAIQSQLNKSRYVVIDAFFRCDLERLQSFIEAYRKLEVELYFVRHYVDTDSGYLNILTDESKNPAAREKFKERMVRDMLSTAAESREAAIMGGYFDVFVTKYRERAKSYKSFSEDNVYEEFFKKIDELTETFQSFGDLANELNALGEDTVSAVTEGRDAIGEGVSTAFTDLVNDPGAAISNGLKSTINRVKLCEQGGDPEECAGLFDAATGEGVDFIEQEIPNVGGRGRKSTYDEIKIQIAQQDALANEAEMQREMITRYAVLYGQVNDTGIASLKGMLFRLIGILGRTSLTPMKAVAQCAEEVKDNECK